MDRIQFAQFCARMDTMRAVIGCLSRGDYDGERIAGVAEGWAALLGLPGCDWTHPGFLAALDRRIACVKDRARLSEMADGC
jgi:hypothetical protein